MGNLGSNNQICWNCFENRKPIFQVMRFYESLILHRHEGGNCFQWTGTGNGQQCQQNPDSWELEAEFQVCRIVLYRVRPCYQGITQWAPRVEPKVPEVIPCVTTVLINVAITGRIIEMEIFPNSTLVRGVAEGNPLSWSNSYIWDALQIH